MSRRPRFHVLIRSVAVAATLAVHLAGVVPASAEPAGSWSAVSPMLERRAGHTATLLLDGRVLVTGGTTAITDAGAITTSSAEIYDPTSNVWSSAASMSQARSGHVAVLLRSGRVFVFGAGGGEIYSPGTDSWTPVAPAIGDRTSASPSATLLGTGEVLVVGGAEAFEAAEVAEIYTPWTDSWRETSPVPVYGTCCAAEVVTLPSGRALVHGGYTDQGTPGASYEYLPKRDEWVDGPGWDPAMTSGTAMVVLTSGIALTAGGQALCCSPTPQENDAWTYDAVEHEWNPTGSMRLARRAHVMAALPGGGAVVAGGLPYVQDSDPRIQRPHASEVYDPTTGSWRAGGPTVRARPFGAAAVTLPDGRVLMTGGWNFDTVLRASEAFTLAT